MTARIIRIGSLKITTFDFENKLVFLAMAARAMPYSMRRDYRKNGALFSLATHHARMFVLPLFTC